MNWNTFFISFFKKNKLQIEQILDSCGCREGWLQGQLYLANPKKLLTNNGPLKFDLASTDSKMIAEIKICGGDYNSKMKSLINSDVAKLKRANAAEKYMILLVDTRHLDSNLGQWLRDNATPSRCVKITGNNFLVSVWRT